MMDKKPSAHKLEKKLEKAPEKKLEKQPEKRAEKAPEKKLEKQPPKRAEKAPEKKLGKEPPKRAEKAPEKKSEKKLEKQPEKSPEKKSVKEPEKKLENMPKKKSRRRHRLAYVQPIALIGAVLTLSGLLMLWIFQQNPGQESEILTLEPEGWEQANTVPIMLDTADGEDVADETDVDEAYPAPEYAFHTEEITVGIEGIQGQYRIAVINDLHLITDHESGDVWEENISVVKERYETLAITEDGVHAEELWPEIIQYLNYHNFDAVVFAGDLIDYSSNSNITVLRRGIEKLKYPRDRIMYIRSDHDYGGWYGGTTYTDSDGFQAQTYILDGDAGENVIDLGECLILGVNKSYQGLSEGRYDFLNQMLDRDLPTILVTHVPFYSRAGTSLEQRSFQVRNRVYYWDPEEGGYHLDGRMEDFIDRVYAEDSNVVQIIAAHLHAEWDGQVTDTLREHIFSPAFTGSIGIVNVVPAEDEAIKINQKEQSE